MNGITVFKENSSVDAEGKLIATRLQVQKMYDVPKKTLADTIKKLKEDGLIQAGRNLAQLVKSRNQYDAETYSIEEVINIGFRLRSELAIQIQMFARKLAADQIKVLKKEYDFQLSRANRLEYQLENPESMEIMRKIRKFRN